MLIAARNGMMAGKRLPYDAEVEYLESTGTQWIDTGVSPYGRTPKVIIDFATRSAGGGVFGTWGANNTRFQILRNRSDSGGSLGIGTYKTVAWNNYTRYSAVLDATQLSASLNGTVYSGFSAPNGFANYNLYLFWRNNNNGDGTPPIPMFCYSCKVWDGNTLVRDFIPVRFTNELRQIEGAMYDRVSGELFRKQGTGAFIIGPDK